MRKNYKVVGGLEVQGPTFKLHELTGNRQHGEVQRDFQLRDVRYIWNLETFLNRRRHTLGHALLDSKINVVD